MRLIKIIRHVIQHIAWVYQEDNGDIICTLCNETIVKNPFEKAFHRKA